MEDEAILLKIKRRFTKDESIQSLLKIISALEVEIGVLKSEVHEAKDLAEKMRTERTQTRKQWLQDEVCIEFNKQITSLKEKNTLLQKQANEWRDKYFQKINLPQTINP